MSLPARRALTIVKVIHTIVWAFFVACIVGMPLASWRGQHALAAGLGATVALEVGVLAVNRWSCPLTAVAGRYTTERPENFDIYLPRWLARNNKTIFGSLYVAGLIFVIARWALSSRG